MTGVGLDHTIQLGALILVTVYVYLVLAIEIEDRTNDDYFLKFHVVSVLGRMI